MRILIKNWRINLKTMRSKYFQYAVLLLSLLSFSCTSNTEQQEQKNEITGKVIKILDGDTYDLLTADKQTLRIRMEGIDAPEKGMPFYRVSKNYLGSLCFQKEVMAKIKETDVHGRLVADTYIDGKEMGQEMIKAGLAWHFKKYSSDEILANLEIEARNNKKGLWVDPRPIAPWEIRRLHREGISTKDSFGVKQ